MEQREFLSQYLIAENLPDVDIAKLRLLVKKVKMALMGKPNADKE